MSTKKQNEAKQSLLKQIEQLSKIDLKQQIQWLLVVGKSNFSQTGFVLPTTVMVLLVATLVVGALLVRSFSRTSQVISEREQKVIYNTATPAIDRAKAKIEYLFKKDDRLPSGVPSDAVLLSMMLNDGLNGIPEKATDKYTFTDETRLNVGGTTDTDNAWAFQVDKDGDGTLETTIAYSILSNTKTGAVGINSSEATKASNLIVRNGPIAGSQIANVNCLADNRAPEQGWYPITNTTLRKGFQIDAFVVNDNPANRTVATLELQQDRQINRGNKWGAWFRNDLEIFPGPRFDFNGAMHTEGSLIMGNDNEFTSYMLSSHNSCFYTQDASEITVGKTDTYEGQMVSGRIGRNSFVKDGGGNYSSTFHLFKGLGVAPEKTTNTTLNKDTDSITQDSGSLIENISLDPIAVFTRNVSQNRALTGWSRATAWADKDFVTKRRIFNDTSTQPYVDDTYRADNRYGPKPEYNSALKIPSGNKIGDTIVAATGTVSADDVTAMTNDAPAAGSEAYGLDGYWERRARGNGLRLIVGQRLELGNAYRWGGVDDPLNPSDSTTISNEQRQRRALRDNLAAVQATAVYHHEKNSGYFPVACVATTVHPGTAQTIADSTNFTTRDFFTGKGTNGWEYAPPASDETTFATAIGSTQPLGKALRNLAYFAGDPDGAFPPKQETSGSIVHPQPNLTMWGDFSNLRRVIKNLNAGTTYSALSIADKTYLHTASCNLGMLAQNIKDANAGSSDLFSTGSPVSLGEKIWQGFTGRGSGTTDLTGKYCSGGSVKSCTLPPVEVLLAGLTAAQRREVLAFNTTQQIKRDRKYGFMSVATASGAFAVKDGSDDYTFNFSPACNPDISGSDLDGVFSGGGVGLTPKKAGLAMICEVQTKYPSLYYLFPVANHVHDDDTLAATDPRNQPDAEPYVGNTYIEGNPVNGSYTYQLLNDTDVAAIAIAPRDTTDWILPKTTTASGSPNTIVAPNGANLYVPFLDTALFNGREMMSVRVLNIDLDLLRKNLVTVDTWLPSKDGIIYAFREDAVREDSIARPASTTWSTYVAAPNDSTSRMNAGTPKDPPVNSTNGISAKAVDYYADPNRRPYGFRLKNGQSVRRVNAGITAANNINGLSFISDNPAYIQGDFNLHSTNETTGSLIEEFSGTPDQRLGSDWTTTPEFYGGRTTINANFADPAQDTWRPTEILADAVTILSTAFREGAAEDAFLKARPANPIGANNTSYQNQNRPTNVGQTTVNTIGYWLREDPTNKINGVSPVKINKNGSPLYCPSTIVPCPTQLEYKYDAI